MRLVPLRFLSLLFLILSLWALDPQSVTSEFALTSCNCTQCCYSNSSKLNISINYLSDGSLFEINFTGEAVPISEGVDCVGYIQSEEVCNQTSQQLNGTVRTRELDCLGGMGSITLIAQASAKSPVQLLVTQDEMQCLIEFSGSLRFPSLLALIIPLNFLIHFLLS